MYDKHLRRVVSESYKWKTFWSYEYMKIIYVNCGWRIKGRMIIAVMYATFAVAKRKPGKKKNQACIGFEPLPSAMPVQRSTSWANKPTVSRSLNWFVINPWKDDDEVMNTAISRKVVGKNMNATIPKGHMGYDQHALLCCLPSAFANVRLWPLLPFLSNFFEEQWTPNRPQYLSGLSRALFPTTFLEIALYENHICELRWRIKWRMIIPVIYATFFRLSFRNCKSCV